MCYRDSCVEEMGKKREDQEPFEALSASKMYSDYRDAFAKATGLPLTLHKGSEALPTGNWHDVRGLCRSLQNRKSQESAPRSALAD